jgi:hypothetical protein
MCTVPGPSQRTERRPEWHLQRLLSAPEPAICAPIQSCRSVGAGRIDDLRRSQKSRSAKLLFGGRVTGQERPLTRLETVRHSPHGGVSTSNCVITTSASNSCGCARSNAAQLVQILAASARHAGIDKSSGSAAPRFTRAASHSSNSSLTAASVKAQHSDRSSSTHCHPRGATCTTAAPTPAPQDQATGRPRYTPSARGHPEPKAQPPPQ